MKYIAYGFESQNLYRGTQRNDNRSIYSYLYLHKHRNQ